MRQYTVLSFPTTLDAVRFSCAGVIRFLLMLWPLRMQRVSLTWVFGSHVSIGITSLSQTRNYISLYHAKASSSLADM